MFDRRLPPDHRIAANTTELMGRCSTGQVGVMSNVGVSTQENMIGQDRMVFDVRVMADVGRHHDHVLVSYTGRLARLESGVNRHHLANLIAVAEYQISRAFRRLQMLRSPAENGTVFDPVVLSQDRVSFEGNVVR